MIYIDLKKTEISSVDISYKKPTGDAIQLETRYKYNVEYSEDSTSCIAHLTQIIQERCDTPSLLIKVKMNGYFTCTGVKLDDDKRACHVLAYQNLFPYMQSAFSTLSTAIGLPNIIIPKDHLRIENISITSTEPKEDMKE